MDPRAYRRFRKNRGALVGSILVLFVTLLGLLGPSLAPHSPEEQWRDTLLTDEGTPVGIGEIDGHPLGADTVGRDELSRLLHGGSVSLRVAFIATLIAVAMGLLVGITSGYFGGILDTVSMRFVDLFLSIPFLLLAITIQSVVKRPELWTLYLLLGFLSWTTLARITRAKTLQVRELEYVQAAIALGMRPSRILLRHVLPNVLGPAIVIGTTLVAQMIIAESAMSYLGLGVQPPIASWGSMLKEGQDMLRAAPQLMLLPALLIVITVFGFNLMGEGLRDAFDPKD
ncbi:MAG: ABC-type dipeptide/oligopeptide/nickel transport system permease subunit [Polyangiales bacterium]